ncbi:unnamed protein product [Linum trigynum]|uniref:FYVE-type domain-containing protein n=1 Tax=Linum trigynum TaxID=586398 RepID=A0AAV2FI80_9ROSI
MLEKIGLPPKPSQRGNNWVVDATHCQGCASQFTFINRKHHCRRCGGLFCGTCTQQRMVLRGQGDSPVRICDPCKQLEEAARFELRHGHKNRAGKGASSKSSSRDEDEVLNQILGSSSSASSLTTRGPSTMDHGGEISRSYSVDGDNHVNQETTPEELRKRAVEEKGKYKILKGEGKSDEALKAFKRGKELERQADALELTIRKNRRKGMSSVSSVGDSGKKGRLHDQGTKEKDDFLSELRDLGLPDMDLQEKDKKTANLTLEGELYSLLGNVSEKNTKERGAGGIDKSQVVALKKKALMLKREGKLDEAKQELKKAKILEKELEEQELLGGAAEDSDDEIAALIRGMDGGKDDDDLLSSYDQPDLGFNFNSLSDDTGFDINVEVTDDDLVDPEMTAALRSLGWTDECDAVEVSIDREAMSKEILSLKKEALNLKRAGNVAEAMAQLKKAKLLEKNLESLDGGEPTVLPKTSTSQLRNLSKDVVPPKSRMTIQKELLSSKKKALSLRREGKLDEAEEELRKGKILEKQLEEMDNATKVSSTTVEVNFNLGYEDSDLLRNSHDGDVDVTEEDLSNPTYLSLLSDLGWKEESSVSPVTQSRPNVPPTRTSTKTRGELQRELLGLKRKALTLRREGKPDEADEVLRSAKELEIQIADMDQPKKETQVESDFKEDSEAVTEKDMHDPALLSVLNSLGWKGETVPAVAEVKPSVQVSASSVHFDSLTEAVSTSRISHNARRSKGEIQRELLGLKRKALAHRRKGETEEADELLKMANVLQTELEEQEDSRPIESETPESLIDRHENVKIPANTTETTRLMAAGSKDSVVVSLPGEVGNASSVKVMDQVGSSRNEQATDRSKDHSHVPSSVPSSSSQEEESSVQQQVLARKRKALALKREGKLAEAREELRQAKLLEREILPSPETHAQEESPPAKKKEPTESSSVVAPPKQQLSGRDRFKLQQESLSHKRQALKLRREGRTQEAEAEFELAKALEAQLEASQDSNKPEMSDDVGVDEVLDPQLLAALRAIGIDDPTPKSQQAQPVRVSPSKAAESVVVAVGDERSELEERIKAEKVKAVNLKRAGKQAEAVDALRRAKMYEKRLGSLASN